MEGLISKVLIHPVFSHDEFVLINNVLKQYNEMKEEIKNLKIPSVLRSLTVRECLSKILVYL